MTTQHLPDHDPAIDNPAPPRRHDDNDDDDE